MYKRLIQGLAGGPVAVVSLWRPALLSFYDSSHTHIRSCLGSLVGVLLLWLLWVPPAHAAAPTQETDECRITRYTMSADAGTYAWATSPEEGVKTEEDSEHEMAEEFFDTLGIVVTGISRDMPVSAHSSATSGPQHAEAHAHAWASLHGGVTPDGNLSLLAFHSGHGGIVMQDTHGDAVKAVAGGYSSARVDFDGNKGLGAIFQKQVHLDGQGNEVWQNVWTFGQQLFLNLAETFGTDGSTQQGIAYTFAFAPCHEPALRVNLNADKPQEREVQWMVEAEAAANAHGVQTAAAAACHLYRAQERTGPFTRINDEPIACSGGLGAASYQEYSYTDSVEGDDPYFYKLEIVDEDGSSTTYGPAVPLQWLVEQPPTIDLASFTATSLDANQVRLAWRTTTELGSAGFTIHTASAADGSYTRLDESFTPSHVLPFQFQGETYSYPHTVAAVPVYYKLEVIDLEGNSTFYGPVQAQEPVDLMLSKQVTPSTVAPGQPLTYTLVFTNTSPTLAADVVLSDQLPTELEGVAFTSSIPVTPTGTLSYTWQLGDLLPGVSGVLTVTGRLANGIAAGTVITNTATLAAPGDINLENDQAQVAITTQSAVSDDNRELYLPAVIQ